MAEGRRVTADDLARALERSVRSVVGLLGAVADPAALTPGGQWTVVQTAAHLLAGTRLYTSLLEGAPSPLTSRDAYEPFNAGVFLGQPCSDPAQLGQMAAAAAGAYLEVAVGVGVDQPRPWHYGRSVPSAMHTALLVNEYLMHGTDVARATGTAWAGDDDDAAVAWRVLGRPLTVARFLPDIAGDLETRVAVGLAGEEPAVFRIAAGVIRGDDDDAEVDCVITGAGMALLRWFFQRDPWDAAGVHVTGPRPELAAQLAELLRRI